jgi:6-phosphogluconolactonase
MTFLSPWLVRIAFLAPLSLLALTTAARALEPAAQGTVAVFIGTYTEGESKGIYRFDLDLSTGKPSVPRLAAETISPSFLAFDPTRRFLYAVGEVNSFEGKKGGGVSAFAVDPGTGALSFLNAQSSGGAGPCHLVVDRTGKNVLVANYGGGSVAVLPVGPDGRLKESSAFIQHRGSSVNAGRQKEPHAHSVNVDAANRFAFVADLGLDEVLIYKLDPAQGTLTPNDPPAAKLTPGAGPRHFAFHPSGKFAYAINELNSTVHAWTYDADRGALTDLQTISTLPEGFKGTNYPAEVQVHPSGKFLYGSNRGHDSIVVYAIDPSTGKLTYVENQDGGIKNPRNFGIDPSGSFLLAASQDLGSIVVFRIDPSTGALSPTGHSVKVPKPVCVKFWKPAG